MQTSSQRPVFLNLIQIRLPIAGIISIVHRIAGAVLFLLTPLLIYLLDLSLSGEEGFQAVAALFEATLVKLIFFLVLWALVHHLFAGIRYLLLDIHLGVERPIYRYTAWLVMLAAPLTALFLTAGLL